MLEEANRLFDWRAATLLPDGRMLGRPNPGKINAPSDIPDRRIVALNRAFPLNRKRVLEIGCFEGVHTTGLRQFGADVTAIDLRPTNVFKTLARLSLHGADAKVFVANCETIDSSFGTFDLIFHFGVLYHLIDPVAHVLRLGAMTDALYLDTHVASPQANLESYEVEGARYMYRKVDEGGWENPFSGAYATALHLTLPSLARALGAAGFAQQRIVQARDERHGPRVLILAAKSLDVSKAPEAAAEKIAALMETD